MRYMVCNHHSFPVKKSKEMREDEVREKLRIRMILTEEVVDLVDNIGVDMTEVNTIESSLKNKIWP